MVWLRRSSDTWDLQRSKKPTVFTKIIKTYSINVTMGDYALHIYKIRKFCTVMASFNGRDVILIVL